jgi:very-short-patch-repair endonuclease
VRRQFGVVARRQLLGLGISRRAIDHALAKDRLFPAFRGVYAVGRPELTRNGWWMAAVLACGPDAVLSHGSAAALWGIRPFSRELERLLLPIARRAGLPKPLTQVYVNGQRVDFYFPELGVVVETDGLRYHRTPAQQARDRERDQAHFAADLVPLRFTRAQVKFQPAHVEEVLAAVAARRGRRPPQASSPAR